MKNKKMATYFMLGLLTLSANAMGSSSASSELKCKKTQNKNILICDEGKVLHRSPSDIDEDLRRVAEKAERSFGERCQDGSCAKASQNKHFAVESL